MTDIEQRVRAALGVPAYRAVFRNDNRIPFIAYADTASAAVVRMRAHLIDNGLAYYGYCDVFLDDVNICCEFFDIAPDNLDDDDDENDDDEDDYDDDENDDDDDDGHYDPNENDVV